MLISKPTYLKQISKWLLLALALTPLMAYKNGMFPYIFGKTLFIRLVVTVFAIFFTWYLFRDREFSRQRLPRLFRNPVVIIITLFLLLAAVSTALGVDPYRSFFGNVERGEGLLSLIYFWTFFIGAFLLFEKKDWLTFLKVTLVVGAIVVVDAFADMIGGDNRPGGHIIGNPSFIAAYLMFVIFSALAVRAWSKGKLWRVVSPLVIVAAVAGILISKTRGALIGLLVGLLAVLVYTLWAGKNQTIRLGRSNLKLRTLAGALLSACLLFAILFVLTASQPIWQNVPGLDRLAGLSLGENTTWQTRLLSAGSSLASVSPQNEGWARLVFGWGPENFGNAYNAYYNPAYYKYSAVWFDKAHNQVLDVLVANGLLGLLAYLALWGFAVYGLLKYSARDRNEGPNDKYNTEDKLLLGAAGIFFAVAYFVQNLALFDQVATYIPVFAFMALTAQTHPAKEMADGNGKNSQWFKFASLIFAALLLFAFLSYTLVPAQQMKNLVAALKSGNAEQVSAGLDKATQPYTYVQMEIRSELAQTVMQSARSAEANELLDKSIALLKESIDREMSAPARFAEMLGDAYTVRGAYASDEEYQQHLEAGEHYLRLALEQAPSRQKVMIQLTRNLIQQGKFDEVEQIITEMLALEPNALNARFNYDITIAPYRGYKYSDEALSSLGEILVDPDLSIKYGNATDIRSAYQSYLIYFYRTKNSNAFLATMQRAVELEKLIDEVNAWRLEIGKIKELPESKVADMEKNVGIFQQLGWDGVSL